MDFLGPLANTGLKCLLNVITGVSSCTSNSRAETNTRVPFFKSFLLVTALLALTMLPFAQVTLAQALEVTLYIMSLFFENSLILLFTIPCPSHFPSLFPLTHA